MYENESLRPRKQLQVFVYLVQRSQDGHFVVVGFAEATAMVEVDRERMDPEGLQPGIAYQVWKIMHFTIFNIFVITTMV